MNAIEMKGVTKRYKEFTLNDLTLTLPSGCILGLVGENGAGKSTTIRLLLNMIRKDAGTIRLLGETADDAHVMKKDDIGVVLDSMGLPLMLKPLQIGRIMEKAYTRWEKETYRAMLELFSIPQNRRFSDMSNGTRMKLGLAIALSHRAKLLILDEATNGLDPVVREEVNRILMEFTRSEEHAILISSHLVTDLEKICDYIAFLKNGRLILCEEKDALVDAYAAVLCDAGDLEALETEAVLSAERTAYGARAIVRRDRIPAGFQTEPVTLEELFITMAAHSA